jgi:mannose-6-phosphate isomerase-like protein (cupin superfamily)
MKQSRRAFALAIPTLAMAQNSSRKQAMPSGAFRQEDMPATHSGPMLMRQILNGETHTQYLLDLHESELPAGEAPHPPHHHVHEEMPLMREGQLDVTITGKTTRLGPGSVAYLASNQEHGWRNPGPATAKYFVLAVGSDAG